MQYEFEKSFVRDFRKVKEKHLAQAILDVIDMVADANTIKDVKNVKKMSGFKSAYRIRIGDYRIGVFVRKQIVIFAAFAHRKDIYRKFP